LIFLAVNPNNVYASNHDNSEILLSCNCVAFRIDDVSDRNANTHYEIINLFVEEEIPITLGIIGNGIGENTKLTDLIKENVFRNVEVASHGWEHENFSKYSLEEQTNLMILSSKKIFELFGMKPKVFIPPYNNFNNNTISAAQEIGFTHISAGLGAYTDKYPLQNQTFYHFPKTVHTVSQVDKFELWHMRSHKDTWVMIKHSLSKLGFAVVMMHPTEFSKIESGKHIDQIDKEHLQELKLLLALIKDADLKIVPIGRINLDSEEFTIPQWIKNTAKWWSEGSVNDEDYVNGLQYLITEGIITIPPTQSGQGTSQDIPEWVRNTTGWWAVGLLTDSEFVAGIQYLIENGIIRI